MIKNLNRANRFRRSYKKLSSKIKRDFDNKIKIFVVLEECLAFDLIDGFRVLFYFEDDSTANLIDIGAHDKYREWKV